MLLLLAHMFPWHGLMPHKAITNRQSRFASKRGPLFRGRAFLGQLLATLGYCYGQSGQLAEAETLLDELRQFSREHYVSAYDIATIYAGMGNHEQAMESLRTAAEEHAFWLILLPKEPLFDPCGV